MNPGYGEPRGGAGLKAPANGICPIYEPLFDRK
jgi:hypothetical protein